MKYPVEALIVGSILSSVCLVVVNKQIFSTGIFPYVFALSTMHFIVTFGLLNIMSQQFKLFEVKYMPLKMNLIVALFGVGSICLMNFSLKLNSVGFYQMLKLCIVPTSLVISAMAYKEYASKKVIASLFFVLLGVGIATVTDVQLNRMGSIVGAGAVFVTAQYQLWQGKKQKEFGLSGNQLALSVSLYQILWGVCFTVVFESADIHSDVRIRFAEHGTFYSMGLIGLSCLLAVSVNVHSFALIGKTSAVTFQVVGHGKTCLILLSGYYMHVSTGKPIDELYKNMFGVAVALSGVALYGNLKLNANTRDWCDKFLPDPILSLFQEPLPPVASLTTNKV